MIPHNWANEAILNAFKLSLIVDHKTGACTANNVIARDWRTHRFRPETERTNLVYRMTRALIPQKRENLFGALFLKPIIFTVGCVVGVIRFVFANNYTVACFACCCDTFFLSYLSDVYR